VAETAKRNYTRQKMAGELVREKDQQPTQGIFSLFFEKIFENVRKNHISLVFNISDGNSQLFRALPVVRRHCTASYGISQLCRALRLAHRYCTASYMAMKSASAVAAILDSALTKTEGGWEVEISNRA
jgi:hypothetical protein